MYKVSPVVLYAVVLPNSQKKTNLCYHEIGEDGGYQKLVVLG